MTSTALRGTKGHLLPATSPMVSTRTLILLGVLAFAGCEEAPPSGWDRDHQGIGVPVAPNIVARLEAYDEDKGQIDDLDPAFRSKLQALLTELRRRGWAARVAIGPREVEEQLSLFQKRRSRVLRGAHLCGRAADLSLYPIGMPSSDHPFWDVKDEVAVGLGLDVVDYDPDGNAFVDRPHVQSRGCDTADWDRLGLSPVGRFRGPDTELRVTRTAEQLNAVLTAGGNHRALEGLVSRREETTHTLTFDGGTAEFSVMSNESHQQPDYRSVRLTVGEKTLELKRAK